MLEPEHSGHQQLAKGMMNNIPQSGKTVIKKIFSKVVVGNNVETPLAPIELQGYLKGSHYERLNHPL